LQEIEEDPNWYSNPQNKAELPFPFIYNRLPVDRFHLKGSPNLFEYMGRERFSDLWTNVQSMKLGVSYSQLYIHGSMGYGKSYILAALACLLSRRGKRVVYLPDCRQALRPFLPYLQSALLCAFADPSSTSLRDKIRQFKTAEDATNFVRTLGNIRLYFIVDQINALEHEDVNTDNVSNTMKDNIRDFLFAMFVSHYSITSASANYRTALHMRQKQTSEIKMTMIGGMSEVCTRSSFPLSIP
jgi:hypothetical protein